MEIGYLVILAVILLKVPLSKGLTTVDTNSSAVNLSFNCPNPSEWDTKDKACICDRTNDVWRCNEIGQVAILIGNCATFDDSKNTTEFGRCYYNSLGLGQSNYHYLPKNLSDWNQVSCGSFKRTGALCGKCEENHTVYAYSFDLSCTKCNYSRVNVVLYILAAFLPLTVFCAIVLLCRCNISSSRYRGYILFSQIIASPIHMRIAYMYNDRNPQLFKFVQFIATVYGIWNLDFFRVYIHGICLKTEPLTTLALDLLVAIYPMVLVLVTSILSKFNSKIFVFFKNIHQAFNKNWDIKTSVVDSLATFLFLSYVKFLSVSFDLLAPVYVTSVSESGHSTSWRLYYNASTEYFGLVHLPFALLAIIVNLLFVVTPTVILLVYPMHFFQRCLSYFPRRFQIYLSTFVDPFQGCFKDGTRPGTKDCRWFSAVPFMIHLALLLVFYLTMDGTFYEYAAMVIVIAILITIVINPYKTELNYLSYHFSMFLFLLNLYLVSSLIFSITTSYWVLIVSWVFLALPLVYGFGLLLRWTIENRKFKF